eukprot:8020131-Prorocentrum_lima.AAC.1
MEYISITGVRRGTGDAGATPNVPVVEVVEEDANADEPEPIGEAPGSADVVGAPEDPPIDEDDPNLGAPCPGQGPDTPSAVNEPEENPETLPATSTCK